MSVLTAVAAPPSPALPQAESPACSIQRSGSLWQLGIEAQELTTAIAQLAERLETDDPDKRQLALGELEAALLADEGNKAAIAAKAVAERFRAAVATCWVIEHLRGQAAYRQQQAKRLTALAAGDNGRADDLETSLVLVLTRLQPKATRFSLPNHEPISRRSSAVEIDDEAGLAAQWLTVTTTTATTTPTTPRPKGHIWSTRLGSWVVPITRKGSDRPSPDHIFRSEPPCWLLIEPLDPATIHQLCDTIRALPRPALEGFTKAFRKRFQVPPEVHTIADRICERRHHDWIETFLVQHAGDRTPAMAAGAAVRAS